MENSVVLQAMKSLVRSFGFLAIVVFFAGVKPVHAEVIDRIEINKVGNEAEIQIQFITRIQYLRQASLKNGDVRIYFNLLEIDALDPRLVPETKDSPPSKFAPKFTVTYPELDSSLTISFGKAVSYRVRPGKNGRSISIFTPTLKSEGGPKSKGKPVAPAIVLSSATLAPEEVEREAKQMIDSAREALGREQLDTAIESLNRVLNLPPNQQSQAAQEQIAEAREKNGEFDKARVEYELYLKLYPDAKDVKRVKERLARLPAEPKGKVEPQAADKEISEEKMMFFGSFAQNYYNGVSHSDTTTVNGLSVTNATLTGTDQSMLISSLDLSGRKRTETTDTRIVFRDDYKLNFLSNAKKKNDNRLTAFYVEQSARDKSYLYRLGRQRGTSGGVPGRFDGAWLGYSPNSTWRVNGVVGTPVEFIGAGLERKLFAGMSVDLTRLPEQWSGSGYFIQQRVGNVVDSQSIGAETHYFDTQRNYMGLLDYDTLFKAVNIAMFQGNWTTEGGDNYLLLADHRKSPTLQITNALPGQTSQSIATLVQSGVSKDALRADAFKLTQNSNLFMVGMTHGYSARWRFGGDFRVTNMSGTGAVGALPAAPGTGNTYVYSAQAIGNSLLLENDLGVASASYISAPTFQGQSLSLVQTENLRELWRLDVSLQLYNQKNNAGVRQTRTSPSVKLSYKMKESLSIDGEGGIEDTHTTSATQNEKVRRTYFYLGYRWDFR